MCRSLTARDGCCAGRQACLLLWGLTPCSWTWFLIPLGPCLWQYWRTTVLQLPRSEVFSVSPSISTCPPVSHLHRLLPDPKVGVVGCERCPSPSTIKPWMLALSVASPHRSVYPCTVWPAQPCQVRLLGDTSVVGPEVVQLRGTSPPPAQLCSEGRKMSEGP